MSALEEPCRSTEWQSWVDCCRPHSHGQRLLGAFAHFKAPIPVSASFGQIQQAASAPMAVDQGRLVAALMQTFARVCLAAHSLLRVVSEHSRFPMGTGIRLSCRRFVASCSALDRPAP